MKSSAKKIGFVAVGAALSLVSLIAKPALVGLFQNSALAQPTSAPSPGVSPSPKPPASVMYKCPPGYSVTPLQPNGQKIPGAVLPTATDGSVVPNTVTCAPQ